MRAIPSMILSVEGIGETARSATNSSNALLV
jgi:hypothetical protein